MSVHCGRSSKSIRVKGSVGYGSQNGACFTIIIAINTIPKLFHGTRVLLFVRTRVSIKVSKGPVYPRAKEP